MPNIGMEFQNSNEKQKKHNFLPRITRIFTNIWYKKVSSPFWVGYVSNLVNRHFYQNAFSVINKSELKHFAEQDCSIVMDDPSTRLISVLLERRLPLI